MRCSNRVVLANVCLASLVGCVEQEPDRPTEKDLKRIAANILKEPPKELPYKVDVDFEGKATYLGLDVSEETITPGKSFKLTHYWKVNKALPGWRLFVHLNSEAGDYHNADHKPIDGAYPVRNWKAGEILRDEHRVTIPAGWRGKKLMVHVGLWRGALRLKPSGGNVSENRLLTATLPVNHKAGKGKPAKDLKRLIALRTSETITLDGKLSEATWKKAASTGPFVLTMTGGVAPVRTEAKVAWDEKHLYVAFESDDPDVWAKMNKRDDKLWTQEVVELYLDANGDGRDYIELQVSPNGTIFDSYLPAYRRNDDAWNSQLKVGVQIDGTLEKRDDTDKGWTVEMAIPWQDTTGKGTYALTLPPTVGTTWRANFFRFERPEGKPAIALGWSAPLVGDFHKLDRFGVIAFGDEQGKLPEPPSEAKQASAAGAKAAPLRSKITVLGDAKRLKESATARKRLEAAAAAARR